MIPGSGRSTGEGIGYPLQYPWALVAQLVKNMPEMWETWVRSLGWEDSLEKRKATYSSILNRRIPWTIVPCGHEELDMTEQFSLSSKLANFSGKKPSFAELNEGTFKLYGGGKKLLSWETGGGVFFSGYERLRFLIFCLCNQLGAHNR